VVRGPQFEKCWDGLFEVTEGEKKLFLAKLLVPVCAVG
jgi:hypothetical protein